MLHINPKFIENKMYEAGGSRFTAIGFGQTPGVGLYIVGMQELASHKSVIRIHYIKDVVFDTDITAVNPTNKMAPQVERPPEKFEGFLF